MKIDSSTIGINNISTQTTNVEPVKVKAAEIQRIESNTENTNSQAFMDLSQKPKQELTIDEKQWVDMIEQANKKITGAICSFEYSIHEVTKQIMVKVIDKDTKEIIREIPPEKVLDMVAHMWEVAGILVDERR